MTTTRRFETAPAPHWPATRRVRGVMLDVLLALAPGIALHVAWFGPGLLVQIVLACTAALACEAAMLAARGRPLLRFLGDGSALVTAVLFALAIPPHAPWWIAAIGMFAAIVLAKQLYGGLGQNLFNPAMVGYVVVLVAFPLELSRWSAPGSAPGFVDAIAAIFGDAARLDALAQATPLDAAREALLAGRTLGERAVGGTSWAWPSIALAYAAGGAYLLARRVIHWQVPVALLATVVLVTAPGWLVDPDRHLSPLAELAHGAIVLAAFFIATDPVSGAATPRGRLVFGAGVALIALAIRRWGAYPDGVAFAVLVMNATVPLLDRTTRPRVQGT